MLNPQTRTDVHVKSVLIDALDDIRRFEKKLIKSHSEKALHQFRISVRKTRSLIGQCDGVIATHRLQRFRREFSWLGGVTSAPRDFDVYLLRIEKDQRMKDNEALQPFVSYMQQQATNNREYLYDTLGSVRYKKLIHDWQKFLQQPVPQHSRLAHATSNVTDFARHNITACQKRVLKQGKKITQDSSDEAVHNLRKACKKLRYMIEFFKDLYADKKIEKQIKQLKQLQNQLGDFQDLCVQEDIVNNYIAGLDRDIWAPTRTRQEMDKVRNRQKKEKRKMHKRIPEVFEKYTQEKKSTRP